jgi:hypothetical protein
LREETPDTAWFAWGRSLLIWRGAADLARPGASGEEALDWSDTAEGGDSWHGAACLGKEVPGTAWCV